LDFFFEIYENLPRQGPGDKTSTLKALASLPSLSTESAILDIGCGSGKQTRHLSSVSRANIFAIDIHLPFLKILKKNSSEDTVHPLCASMFDLPFREKTFDLIWSEGALYFLGFEKGLRECTKYLKPGGCIAVTDLCWIKENLPVEIQDFFDREYPQIESIPEHIKTIRNCGYNLINHFILSESSWWDDYYRPLERQIAFYSKNNPHDNALLEFLQEQKKEIEMFRRYSKYYGYVFYIMQKSR